MAPLLGYGKAEPPPGMVSVPRDSRRPGAVVDVRYPRTFSATKSKTAPVLEMVEQVFGGEWEERHDHPMHRLRYVRLAPPPQLPEYVAYEDDPDGDVDLIPFAKDESGEWLRADVVKMTPHMLVAASTRHGKSTIIRSFLAYVLSRPAVPVLADILDPKHISLAEFEGCPNVHYWIEPEDYVRVIAEFRQEIKVRYRAKKAGADLDDHTVWPIRYLVLEEMGSLMAMVEDHWSEFKPAGAKPEPETMRKLQQILWQGAAAHCHVIAAAQQANAKVMRSSDSRDQFALRILAGPTSVNSWAMLFGDAPFMASDPIKGRAIVGVGPDLRPVQLVYLAPAEAAKLALRGAGRFAEAEDVAVPMESQGGADTPGVVPSTCAYAATPPLAPPLGTPQVCRDGHSFSTRAKPGTKLRCPTCKVPVKVRLAQPC